MNATEYFKNRTYYRWRRDSNSKPLMREIDAIRLSEGYHIAKSKNGAEYVQDLFKNLRFNYNHHLGLGDIRLTIAQQDEIISFIYMCPEKHCGNEVKPIKN